MKSMRIKLIEATKKFRLSTEKKKKRREILLEKVKIDIFGEENLIHSKSFIEK